MFLILHTALYWHLPEDGHLTLKHVRGFKLMFNLQFCYVHTRGADKSLARPTSRCILFDGKNISFDASLLICINSTNIPPIMIINRTYEHQNLLSL